MRIRRRFSRIKLQQNHHHQARPRQLLWYKGGDATTVKVSEPFSHFSVSFLALINICHCLHLFCVLSNPQTCVPCTSLRNLSIYIQTRIYSPETSQSTYIPTFSMARQIFVRALLRTVAYKRIFAVSLVAGSEVVVVMVDGWLAR